MLGMTKYLFSILMGFTSIGYGNQTEPVAIHERGLIAVVNLSAGRSQPRSIKTKIYINEELNTMNLIQQKTRDHYGKVVFLFREETNEVLFLKTMQDMAADPEIKTIDMILYAHGRDGDPKYGDGGPSLGLYHPSNIYSRSDYLGAQVKNMAQGKLRMLYMDACWGSTQSQDWLNAGFIAVAGAKLADGNRAIDLKRFFKKWLSGEPFGESISYANKNILGKILDRFVKGDSTKIPVGDLDLTIDQTYIPSN